jgi:hypothetical protein
MVGDIILQDCGKDFVLPVFLLGLPYAHRRFIQSCIAATVGFSLSWCFAQQ